jgi:hypothetical protein
MRYLKNSKLQKNKTNHQYISQSLTLTTQSHTHTHNHTITAMF